MVLHDNKGVSSYRVFCRRTPLQGLSALRARSRVRMTLKYDSQRACPRLFSSPNLKRQVNIVEICKSLDEKGLTMSEAVPLWIW